MTSNKFNATQTSFGPASRFDIYRIIHKALRACMCDTLVRTGSMDSGDPDDVGAALAQVRALLAFCASHLEHENDFVHAAMEARRPESSAATAADHTHHQAALDKLGALAEALEREPSPERAAELYRHLALFVADNLIHMHVEETENNAVLQATHSDAELIELEHAIVASLTPEEKAQTMRWMIPAVNADERAGLLLGMLGSVPAQVFDAMLDGVKPYLAARDWDKLMRALRGERLLAA